jgi:Bax protein
MQNRGQKTYQSSYREQLIKLAKFYGIVEIKNYSKNGKKLTNTQVELILIKNKIKLPSKKTLSKLGGLIIFKNKYLKQLFYTASVVVVVIGFFGGAPYLIENFHKIDSSLWKNKDEIAKYKSANIDKILKKNEIKLKPSKDEEDFIINEKIQIQKDDLINNTVSLSASVVASLFEDLDYDLSTIRKGRKVKPLYISLLPKDISLIEDFEERKQLFIKIVLPLILQENDKIGKDRKNFFKILAKKSNTKEERNWLKRKFKEYKIKNSDISELKVRMDIVPVSLAIAQAAIESGWGTSRFALEGNALYGQWTWSDNGLKPLENNDGDHKVMRFKILMASIRAYKKNLNTHSGYMEFREARAKLRSQNEEVTGLKLTKYLDKYAATGKQYTEKLELTIKKNSLSDFDNAKLLSTGLRKEINL